MSLLPEDRPPPPEVSHPVRIRLSRMTLRHPRQWGGCWLAMELWNQLGLDSFWEPRLPGSREGTEWLNVLKTLIVTPEGIPVACEVMPGNTPDKTPLPEFLHKIEAKLVRGCANMPPPDCGTGVMVGAFSAG